MGRAVDLAVDAVRAKDLAKQQALSVGVRAPEPLADLAVVGPRRATALVVFQLVRGLLHLVADVGVQDSKPIALQVRQVVVDAAPVLLHEEVLQALRQLNPRPARLPNERSVPQPPGVLLHELPRVPRIRPAWHRDGGHHDLAQAPRVAPAHPAEPQVLHVPPLHLRGVVLQARLADVVDVERAVPDPRSTVRACHREPARVPAALLALRPPPASAPLRLLGLLRAQGLTLQEKVCFQCAVFSTVSQSAKARIFLSAASSPSVPASEAPASKAPAAEAGRHIAGGTSTPSARAAAPTTAWRLEMEVDRVAFSLSSTARRMSGEARACE